MTIRLLTKYDQYTANTIVTLDSGTEVGLIATKQASLDLTGGTPYIPPVAPNQVLSVQVLKSPTGAVLGLLDANGVMFTVSGGAGAVDIPFTPVIPLNTGGAAYMPKQNISGPLKLTAAAGEVRNSLVYLPLVANGVNVPDVSDFLEWSGSTGFDNTSGKLNILQLFCDGIARYHSYAQATASAPLPGDTTAPVRQSATVNGNTLVLTYNEALNTAAPALSSYSYVLNNGAAVNPATVVVNGQTVTMTFATGALQGQAAALSYVPGTNSIRDTAGNAAAAFTSIAVTNNTPASDTTAPVIQSATINGANLVITYNEALNTVAPTLSSIVLSLASGGGVSPTSAVVAGATITAVFATAATAGQSAALSYTPGASAIRDAAGNNAVALTAYTVTNSTAAAGTDDPLQFTANPTYYVETVDGNDDYTYSSTTAIGSGYQAVAAMSAAKSLPAGADGGFWFTSSNASSLNTLIGFMAGATAPGQVAFSSWDYSVIDPATDQVYVTRIKAAQTASTVKKEAGDKVGMFLVGRAVIARVARVAAPNTWIDIATIATDVNLKLWPMMQSQQHPAARTFVKPRYLGGLV